MPSFWSYQLAAQPDWLTVQKHGVLELVIEAGPLVQAVLYILILFSVVSWGIILYKYWALRIARSQSEKFTEIFWDSRNLSSIHEASRELGMSPVAQVFRAGYEELLRVSRTKRENSDPDTLTTDLSGVDNVARAMKRAVSVEVTKLEKALTFLATTSSTTPFIGLFGTVWGIMNAFRGLSVTRSSSIQAVAPGIAEALIATAAGLVAAIPALIAYNHFAQRNRVMSADMDNFTQEFLNIAERHFLTKK
jgi:biopolymer transport protein TolQ